MILKFTLQALWSLSRNKIDSNWIRLTFLQGKHILELNLNERMQFLSYEIRLFLGLASESTRKYNLITVQLGGNNFNNLCPDSSWPY